MKAELRSCTTPSGLLMPEYALTAFFNDVAWSRLQMLDSQLALGVIRYLLDQGITPIPIHDSFVVEAQHAGATKEAMIGEFDRLFPGAAIRVERA